MTNDRVIYHVQEFDFPLLESKPYNPESHRQRIFYQKSKQARWELWGKRGFGRKDA